MSRRRLLVTGAGGFCGEHACNYFAAAGWEVAAAVRRPLAGEETARLAAAAVVETADLTSREAAEALLDRTEPDAVLHLAGMNAVGPSWTDPAAAMTSNVMGTIFLLEAVRKSGRPCRIVLAGSMLRFPLPAKGERPAPPHPYSFSKTVQVLTAQSWAAMYGMEIIVAEPCNLIGPGRSTGICTLLARYAAAAELTAECGGGPPAPFKLSSRTERRDLLDVRDAMRAYELLLLKGECGSVYPVASGTMFSLGELADTFASLAYCPLEWEIGSSDAPSPQPADITAMSALGWAPRIPLARSLADLLAQMRSAVRQNV